MSKVFSHVIATDGFKSYEFYVPGLVQDEDDFFNTDCGWEMIGAITGAIDVDVRIYCFGDGESERADETDIAMLTEEFIEKECDCIQGIGFTIYMEDEEYDTADI